MFDKLWWHKLGFKSDQCVLSMQFFGIWLNPSWMLLLQTKEHFPSGHDIINKEPKPQHVTLYPNGMIHINTLVLIEPSISTHLESNTPSLTVEEPTKGDEPNEPIEGMEPIQIQIEDLLVNLQKIIALILELILWPLKLRVELRGKSHEI